jgi:hypothetical protein
MVRTEVNFQSPLCIEDEAVKGGQPRHCPNLGWHIKETYDSFVCQVFANLRDIVAST